MPSSVTYTFNNGDPIVASQHNTNFQDLINYDNGLSSGVNIDPGAITTAKIQAGAITSSLLATGAVTGTKIETSVTLTTPNIGAATGTSLNTTGQVTDHVAINEQTVDYTLQLSDDAKFIVMNLGVANTLTIPLQTTSNIPVGSRITVLQKGAGTTTIAGVSGVQLNGTPGLKLRAQWSACTIVQIAQNAWVAIGDLKA